MYRYTCIAKLTYDHLGSINGRSYIQHCAIMSNQLRCITRTLSHPPCKQGFNRIDFKPRTHLHMT